MPEPSSVIVNGLPVSCEGHFETAVAIALTRTPVLRCSVSGQPRGPLCGMGVCFECRATIDGEPQRLTCQTPCKPGMTISTDARSSTSAPWAKQNADARFPVLVVGSGPAGLAAACAAAECGQTVGVVDDNLAWGGQIWRGAKNLAMPNEPHHWFSRAVAAKVQFFDGTRVAAQPQPGCLVAETGQGTCTLHYDRLILAVGAREFFLPFPGWTLPNVMGAGGLQALVKMGLPIEGQRVVIAGSGPLLLAVAAYLRKKGAAVALIAEQVGWGRMARFGAGLVRHPNKLVQAAGLRWQLRGIPLRTGCWPAAALGTDRLTGVLLTDGRKTWTEPCDYLACGFGLVPNVELPVLLGCGLQKGAVQVDEHQQTSVDGIYCAGETTGIGGLEKSLVEGSIAGYAAAGRQDHARRLFRQRDKIHRFAAALEWTFALRGELKALAQPDTVVCRCEDVTWGQLQPYDSWRAAKLQTRCGMGPCQGRVCGAALGFLRGWTAESVRPPVFPARVESLV